MSSDFFLLGKEKQKQKQTQNIENMTENLKMNSFRIVCPFDKRYEYEYKELCNCINLYKNNNCSCSNSHSGGSYDTDTDTYNEIVHKYYGQIEDSRSLYHEFHGRITHSVITQNLDSTSNILRKPKPKPKKCAKCGKCGKCEKPATQSTKENINKIKFKKNKNSLFSNCLVCTKMQWPEITKFNSFILSPLMKLFPLLIPSVKMLRKNQKKNVKSKAIMRLLIILARLLCILQVTTVPTSIAIKSTTPQEQFRTSLHQNITFVLNENTNTNSSTIKETNRLDIRTKNIVSKTGQSDIVASSPAPVLSAFLAPGQDTLPLTPIDSRIISFVNRDNILKQFQQKISTNGNTEKPLTNSSDPGRQSFSSSYSSCSSCQLQKAKNDSLESIKMHILSKLRLKEVPKMETPRDVPQNIIKDFNRRFDQNGRRRSFVLSYSNEEIYDESTSSKSYGSHEDYMQNDDPGSFYEKQTLYETDNSDIEDDEDEDEMYSITKSIYIFPTSAHIRHSKRNDFLSFRYQNADDTTIISTILHLYLRGWDWIAFHEPNLLKWLEMNYMEYKATEFLISVHRALKRTNTSNYTHTVQIAEIRQNIPSGMGNWIQIDLKDLAGIWIEGGESHQMIIIKTSESWMRHFIVSGVEKNNESKYENREKGLTAHIEIRTQRRVGRHKRSTSLDCQETDNEKRCCRYPLKVDFKSFGWTFVIAPQDFDAYFCNGECNIGYLEHYTHTHLASLSRSATPCCSPTKMSSLTLLYFNLEHQLVLSTIPNMTVEKCSCS